MAERKRLFVSYARDDQDKLKLLITTFQRLPYDVWMDTRLSGGQEWWDQILNQIRTSDAVLFIVSSSGLESEACTREFAYARAVNRPILPLRIEPIAAESLPRGLGVLQVVDFTSGHQDDLLNLVNALMQLPAAGPLPDPLPPSPDVPASYLWDIAELLQQHNLTRDQQLTIVSELRGGLDRVNRPREREAILELVQRMRSRDDLLFVAAQQLDAMMATSKAEPRVTPQPPPPETPRPQSPPPQPVQYSTPASPPVRYSPPPTPPISQRIARPAPSSGLNGTEIWTIVLLLFCAPIGLITIWFTRWQMWVKLLIAGGVGTLYLIFIVVSIASYLGSLSTNTPSP